MVHLSRAHLLILAELKERQEQQYTQPQPAHRGVGDIRDSQRGYDIACPHPGSPHPGCQLLRKQKSFVTCQTPSNNPFLRSLILCVCVCFVCVELIL